MLSDFAVFILTHGRPDKVVTYNSLKRAGYTGRIYLIIDNEDELSEQYEAKYGEKVIEFDKLVISKSFDTGTNSTDRRTIVYARNASFQIAEKLNIKYFIQLDDDYSQFVYKFDNHLGYKERRVKNLDGVLDAMLRFYKSIDALSVAMAQNGDFIGGRNGSFAKEIKLHRKAMNTFICSTDRPFQFIGNVNEDVNTYVNLGSKGKLFLTVPNVAIIQNSTQKTKGGMTDIYLDQGTYVKSFFSVMYNPSCVKVAEMGEKHRRLHHRVIWNNAVPKIIQTKQKLNGGYYA